MTNLQTINDVIQGDCIAILQALPEASVDMIFADPPYNLQIGAEFGRDVLKRPNDRVVDGVHDAWDKIGTFADYDVFSEAWLTAARRVLKPNGTLWVIGSYHNIFRVGATLQDIGFWILNDIVWRKTNPMPNFRGRRFTNAHETLIWCARSEDSRHTFNYDAMKALNDDLQMRSDWLLPICSGQERLRDGSGRKAHPTQKPEALLHRVILASTQAGDIVLDPFFGTGTTGVVCKKLGRSFIGIERDQSYVDAARKRLAATRALDDPSLVEIRSKRTEPRVAFGALVERGLVKPGEILFDVTRRWTAKVRADGTVISADARGSIHAVGAKVQGAQSCNGWSFWHVMRGGRPVVIDMLRQFVRDEMAGRISTAEPDLQEAPRPVLVPVGGPGAGLGNGLSTDSAGAPSETRRVATAGKMRKVPPPKKQSGDKVGGDGLRRIGNVTYLDIG